MSEKQFTHVCSACHTPVLRAPLRAERAWQTIVLSVVVLLFVLAFAGTAMEHYRVSFLSMIVLAISIVLVGMFFWSHFKLKGAKLAPLVNQPRYYSWDHQKA